MMKKRKPLGTWRDALWLTLLAGLLLASGLLSGSTVGANSPFPTPTPVLSEAIPWDTLSVGNLETTVETEKPARGHPKLGSSLAQLLEVYHRGGLPEARSFATRHMLVLDNSRVQVEMVILSEAMDDVRKALEVAGGEYQGHYKMLVQALLPINTLESLAQRSDVQFVREPRRTIPFAISEGVGVSNATSWHAAGYNGSGVKVAIIDASFDGYTSLLGTDLPASVTDRDYTDTGMGGTKHGTASAEVVYDMAPGIQMYLSKVSTVVELSNAVNDLIADGVDIISMSLGWTIDGSGDGTGTLASIVNNARSHGIFFATAAGNNAQVSWSGQYVNHPSVSGTHQWPHGGNVNCFGPGTDFSCYTIPAGTQIKVGLHWDDWTAVTQDYDLELLRWTGSSWETVASSTNWQNGGAGQTPEEFVSYTAASSAPYAILVHRYSATRDVCFRVVAPKMEHLDEWVEQRSLTFPADSPYAITVGGVDVNPPYPLGSYSSQGPTFGPGGACSGGSTKPDIAAYANVSTVSYGPGGFNGTSAATPHEAGAAALVKQRYPGYSVSQLQSYLESNAIDLGDPGKDNLYGSGRLHLGDPADTTEQFTWTQTSQGMYGGDIQVLALSPNYTNDRTLFTGVQSRGIFTSTDRGASWTETNNGFGSLPSPASLAFSPNYTNDQTIFAGIRGGGVFKSTDGAASWSYSDFDDFFLVVEALVVSPDYANDETVFAGISGGFPEPGGGVFKSTDGGDSWSAVNSGLTNLNVRALALSPNYPSDHTLFAGTDDGVFKSTDGGASWGESGLSARTVQALAISPSYASDRALFAGTFYWDGVYKSTDGGTSWSPAGDGLSSKRVNALVISPHYANDQTLFAGTDDGGVFKSTDGAASWDPTNSGLTNLDANALALSPGYTSDQTIYVGTSGGVFSSADGANAWSGVGPPVLEVNAVAISSGYASDQTLYAGTNDHMGEGGGVFKSTDGGNSWSYSGLTGLFATALAISPDYGNDQTVFAGVWGSVYTGGGVYKSVDGGTSWGATNSGLTNSYVQALAISPNYASDHTLFVGTDDGVFKCSDGGASCSHSGLGETIAQALAISPNYLNDLTIFAGTQDDGIFESNDGGVSWISKGLTTSDVEAITLSPDFTNDQTVFAGTDDDGVFKSTDGADSWNYVGLSEDVFALAISLDYPGDQTIYAGRGNGVYKSTDGGTSWSAMNVGLELWIKSLALNSTDPLTLFAGTNDSGLWQYAFSTCYDFNSNGMVDIGDIMAIAANFGKRSTDPDWGAVQPFDLDRDGDIDLDDVVAAAAKWRSTCS